MRAGRGGDHPSERAETLRGHPPGASEPRETAQTSRRSRCGRSRAPDGHSASGRVPWRRQQGRSREQRRRRRGGQPVGGNGPGGWRGTSTTGSGTKRRPALVHVSCGGYRYGSMFRSQTSQAVGLRVQRVLSARRRPCSHSCSRPRTPSNLYFGANTNDARARCGGRTQGELGESGRGPARDVETKRWLPIASAEAGQRYLRTRQPPSPDEWVPMVFLPRR